MLVERNVLNFIQNSSIGIKFHQLLFYDTHVHPIIFHPLIHFECECIYAIENITKEGEEKRRDKGVSVI